MKLFKVRQGATVQLMGPGVVVPDVKTTVKEMVFEREELVVDPLNPGPFVKTIGHSVATNGGYGFRLEGGSRYTTMFVGGLDVEVL